MNEVALLIVTAVIALLAAILRVRKKQPVPDLSNPPKNQVADVARNSATKEFHDNLQAIEKTLTATLLLTTWLVEATLGVVDDIVSSVDACFCC